MAIHLTNMHISHVDFVKQKYYRYFPEQGYLSVLISKYNIIPHFIVVIVSVMKITILIHL